MNRLLEVIKYFKLKKLIRPLKQKTFYKDINTYRLECLIDETLVELKLDNYILNKKINEFNEMDLDYLIAYVNTLIEKAKGIPLVSVFISLFITFSANFATTFVKKPEDKALLLFSIVVSILITGTIFEKNYKKEIMNYTFLKDILIIYKNKKYK